jgi:DNA (cytosine-5)-methyltransferase 1
MNFKLGEFFCGPGGIAQGAIDANSIKSKKGEIFTISPEWATDYDLDTCFTYARNIHKKNFESDEKVIHGDVRKLNITNLPSCDGFAFGFPCNDFSLVGESKGLNGNFGPLYSYGVEYLKVHQPKWFIAENVGGLSSSNKGDAFKLILSALKNSGYKIYPHLYKFEDYGVPQSRHRIIIVGIRNDIKTEFRVPAPFSINKKMSSFDAITKPPIKENSPNNEITKQSKTVIDRLKYIQPGQNAWSESIPKDLRLNVKGARLSNIYKRLDPNKPAYTVTGSGGGGTHMYHWKENRALTNRERARLQTFPDNFIFQGSKESVRKQIGMAVPPKGISIIFGALLKSFAKIPYDYVHCSFE